MAGQYGVTPAGPAGVWLVQPTHVGVHASSAVTTVHPQPVQPQPRPSGCWQSFLACLCPPPPDRELQRQWRKREDAEWKAKLEEERRMEREKWEALAAYGAAGVVLGAVVGAAGALAGG